MPTPNHTTFEGVSATARWLIVTPSKGEWKVTSARFIAYPLPHSFWDTSPTTDWCRGDLEGSGGKVTRPHEYSSPPARVLRIAQPNRPRTHLCSLFFFFLKEPLKRTLFGWHNSALPNQWDPDTDIEKPELTITSQGRSQWSHLTLPLLSFRWKNCYRCMFCARIPVRSLKEDTSLQAASTIPIIFSKSCESWFTEVSFPVHGIFFFFMTVFASSSLFKVLTT